MPYKIEKDGDVYKVVEENSGRKVGTHKTRDEALKHLKALYVNVPDARSKAAEDKKPYGDVRYADPGYQKDGKKRYPIDTADHVRSAWAYINQASNAAKYTPQQRENIKSRIAGAAKRLGINLNREDAAVRERLTRNYGPSKPKPNAKRVDAIGPKPMTDAPKPKMPPTGPSPEDVDGPSPRQVENMAIDENSRTPEAAGPHPFMQAEFPSDDGTPRCRLCGRAEDWHKEFLPEIPIAAGLAEELMGVVSLTDGSPATTEPVSAPTVKEGETPPLPDDTVKAFLTEVNGRTLLTAPANVFTREVEKALHANKHFLWMQGRFVGAEKPNRNGAFWSTEDLELGQVTVKNGPLNWLHEARHVIGTIAHAQLVSRDEAADRDLDQPYIHAASAIWRWIYPDEAWVVEQASDANKLWYSMECVSEEVACVGDNGCGAKASYGDYLNGQGGSCQHMVERSAVRQFANPTFLGGAVIVPPVRPGWAEADATVMRQAASLAEHTFEQAGKPDVAAAEWEQLMAQVLRFAGAR